MTKLTNMKIPPSINRGGKGMQYCEKCKEWVPEINKHNRKRHNQK